MTDSFAKLLRGQSDKGSTFIPDISETDYLEVKQSATKATEDRIDAGIEDSKDALRRDLSMIRMLANKDNDKIKQLLNITESGIKLNEARKKYQETRKNLGPFLSGETPLTPHQKDERPKFAKPMDKNWFDPKEQDKIISFVDSGSGKLPFSTVEDYKPTQEEKDAFNVTQRRNITFNDKNTPPLFTAALDPANNTIYSKIQADEDASKAQIISKFEVMLPYISEIPFNEYGGKSILDLVNSSDPQDILLVPEALNNALTLYVTKSGLETKFNKRELYDSILPQLVEYKDAYQKRIINVRVTNAFQGQEASQATDIANQILSSSSTDIAINKLFNIETGSASLYGTANKSGLQVLGDRIIYGLKNGYYKGKEDIIMEIINKEIPHKGGGKKKLIEINEALYNSISSAVQDANTRTFNEDDANAKIEISNAQETAHKNNFNKTTNKLNIEGYNKELAPVIEKYGPKYPIASHVVWNQYRTHTAYNGGIPYEQAVLDVANAMSNNGPIPNASFDELPLNHPLAIKAKEYANNGGGWTDFTTTETTAGFLAITNAQPKLFYGNNAIKLVDLDFTKLPQPYRTYLETAYKDYVGTRDKFYQTAARNKTGKELLTAKRDADREARKAIESEIALGEKSKYFQVPIVNNITKAENESRQAIKAMIQNDKQAYLNNEQYISPIEKEVLDNLHKLRLSGSNIIPQYGFYSVTVNPLFPKMSPRQILLQRYEATKGMRTGEVPVDQQIFKRDLPEGINEDEFNNLNNNPSLLPQYIQKSVALVEELTIGNVEDFVIGDNIGKTKSSSILQDMGYEKSKTVDTMSLFELGAIYREGSNRTIPIRIGKYHMKLDTVFEAADRIGLPGDTIFNEEVQTALMIQIIRDRGSALNSGATLDSRYARIAANKWDADDRKEFKLILENLGVVNTENPYNDPKALLEGLIKYSIKNQDEVSYDFIDENNFVVDRVRIASIIDQLPTTNII